MHQIANIHHIKEKTREFQKIIYLYFIDYAELLTVWLTTICGKFSKRWEQQTILPTSWETFMGGQEATVSTRHRTADCFRIEERVWQGCLLSPCLFNLYAEYIMWNAELDKLQAGVKIAERNLNNLRYADDTPMLLNCGVGEDSWASSLGLQGDPTIQS